MSEPLATKLEQRGAAIQDDWVGRLPDDAPVAAEVPALYAAIVTLLRDQDDEPLRREVEAILFANRAHGTEPSELLAALLLFFEAAWHSLNGDPELAADRVRAELWQCAKIVSCTLVALASLHRDEEMRDLLGRLHQVNEQIERYESSDPVTGMLSRRRLLEVLTDEVERAVRYHAPLSLLLLTLEGLEAYNAERGYVAGDELLRGVAEWIAGRCRRVDHVGRLRGNVLAVVLPETPRDGAVMLAQQLREQIGEDLEIGGRKGADTQITAAIGVAALKGEEKEASHGQVVDPALAALSEARESGGNRVVAK